MTSVRLPLILIAAGMIAAVLFGALIRSVRADESGWQTDFKLALDKAKKEKKYVLADFTGSDWCGWCIKLHNEVFDKEPFKTDAPKQFVLLELDYPQQKQQADELKKQNAELSEKYKIEGFPTVLLLDTEGQVIARTGYRDGGSEKYVKFLAELPKIYENVVAAKKKLDGTTGLERAKLLDTIVEGYGKLGNATEETGKQLMAWSKEIITLDADNKAGLKVKYEFPMALSDAEELMKAGKLSEAKAAVDKALAVQGISPDMRQEGLMTKAGIFETEGKYSDVAVTLKAAKDAAPQSPAVEHIDELLGHFGKLAAADEAVRKLQGELPNAKGLDRAKLLDKIVDATQKLPENETAAKNVEKWSNEIIALDADNKAGLKKKYQFHAALGEAEELANGGKLDEAGAAVDKALAMPGIGGEELQKGLVFKAQLARARHSAAEERDSLTKALAAAPNSDIAPQLKQMIQQLGNSNGGR